MLSVIEEPWHPWAVKAVATLGLALSILLVGCGEAGLLDGVGDRSRGYVQGGQSTTTTIVAALLLQVTPAEDGVSVFGLQLPEACAAKRMGGTCPGCGLTRSFALGIKGDPRAFALHPLGPLMLAVVVFQLPYRGFHLLRTRRLVGQGRREEALDRRRWPVFRLVCGLLVALLMIWLVRSYV